LVDLDPGVVARIIVLVVLVILSGFFSSAETALTTVNKLRIRALTEEKSKRAIMVSKLIENPSKMLSAILIGNNIVNLSASSLATTLAIEYFQSIGAGVITGILTIAILIFGEITPKSLATTYAEKLSLFYAPAILLLTYILTPVSFLLNILSRGLLFLFRIDPNKKTATVTESELLTMVEVSHEEGVIESEERTMITNVVDFGDSYAKDVMVPRIDMTFAEDTMSYEELYQLFAEEQYSRMPVYSETRDNVIGIIHLKDVFFFRGKPSEFTITDYMREPFFTYEFKKTSELMNEMRRESIALAIVLDEYGAVAGLVSMEDLLEEIVGEIRDEYDYDEEDDIKEISSTKYEVDGSARLDEISETFGLKLESDDYDSIAGHIICKLGHLPTVGESVTEENVTFTVAAIEKNRIDKVQVTIVPLADDSDADTDN